MYSNARCGGRALCAARAVKCEILSPVTALCAARAVTGERARRDR